MIGAPVMVRADLLPLAEGWALLRRLQAADADLAGSFAWCRAAARTVGEERIAHVGLFAADGALSGIVLLERGQTGWRSGTLGRPCLRWPFQALGYGFGPHWETCAAPDVRAGWFDALRERFRTEHLELARCSPAALPGRSLVQDAAARVAEGAATWSRCVPDSLDDYLATLKGKHRRDLAKYRRDIAAAGGEWIECDGDPPSVAAAFDVCHELHRRRLAEKRAESAYFPERSRRFLLALADELGPAGLRLTLLRCDGRPVAGCLSFVHARRYKAYMSGWDRSHARLDLGRQVIYHQILAEFARGLREIDLLGGDLDYKREFGLERKPTVDAIARPGPAALRRERLLARGLALYRASRGWVRASAARKELA